MLLVGLAFGLGFSALSVAATDGMPNDEQGLAASLFQTSFQVGGALVLAIVTAVVDAGGGGRLTTPAATLAAFVVIESHSRDPLMPLQIFRSGALRRANIGAVTLFGSYVSFQFLATQYLQSLAGWSPISTALAFLPAGVMVAVLSVGVGPLLGRFGTGRLAAAAFACLVAAYAVFLRAGVAPDYPAVLLPTMLLVGLAFGLGFSALSVAATDGMPDNEQGLAASLFQTSFQVGGALVLAVVTAVVDAGGGSRLSTPTATLAAYRREFGDDRFTFWVGGVCCLVLNTNLYWDPRGAPKEQARQEAWFARELTAAREAGAKQILVFQHHPWFLTKPDEPDDYFTIPRARREPALALMRAAGVRAIFAGHYHRDAYGRDGNLEMITTSAVGMPLGNDPSGFRIVKVYEDRIEHTYYGLDEVPKAVSLR